VARTLAPAAPGLISALSFAKDLLLRKSVGTSADAAYMSVYATSARKGRATCNVAMFRTGSETRTYPG
jgi:hypothetical protein